MSTTAKKKTPSRPRHGGPRSTPWGPARRPASRRSAGSRSSPFQHVYLQQPTAAQAALFTRYANGSLPFVDLGNRYLVSQAQYQPAGLEGRSWAKIAAAMRAPASSTARDIDGAANSLTAAMCVLTHGQPGGVCTSAGVKAAAGSL